VLAIVLPVYGLTVADLAARLGRLDAAAPSS
jgi:hypothetical protein